MQKLTTAQVTPVFLLTSLIHGASVATQFDVVRSHLPVPVDQPVLLAQFPLLLIAGYFESRVDHGSGVGELWMRIRSRPMKLSFTLAITYLLLIVATTWKVSLGPLGAVSQAGPGAKDHDYWLLVMSGVIGMGTYLIACNFVIPVLRVLVSPLKWLPTPAGAGVAALMGGALGYGALLLVQARAGSRTIAEVQTMISEKPALLAGVTLGMIFVPLVVGWLLGRRRQAETE